MINKKYTKERLYCRPITGVTSLVAGKKCIFMTIRGKCLTIPITIASVRNPPPPRGSDDVNMADVNMEVNMADVNMEVNMDDVNMADVNMEVNMDDVNMEVNMDDVNMEVNIGLDGGRGVSGWSSMNQLLPMF